MQRIAQALTRGGIIIIREPDGAMGWRFMVTRTAERLSAMLRGDYRQRFHYRPASAWLELLERHGLTASATPMWSGTPFSNVLFAASREI